MNNQTNRVVDLDSMWFVYPDLVPGEMKKKIKNIFHINLKQIDLKFKTF
jgi:hypothetical protein